MARHVRTSDGVLFLRPRGKGSYGDLRTFSVAARHGHIGSSRAPFFGSIGSYCYVGKSGAGGIKTNIYLGARTTLSAPVLVRDDGVGGGELREAYLQSLSIRQDVPPSCLPACLPDNVLFTPFIAPSESP